MKTLYLHAETAESIAIGKRLKDELLEHFKDLVSLDTYLSTNVTQVMFITFLCKYDIIIFDGSIEDDSKLNNIKYDFLNPSLLLRENFFVVTRNTLPMNIVPPHSNLNQFETIINNSYKIDKNRLCDSVSSVDIVKWVIQELQSFITLHKNFQRPATVFDIFTNLTNDVNSVMNLRDLKKKKQIFVSFRGKYQNKENIKEKDRIEYYGYDIKKMKDMIMELHSTDNDEWEEPFAYDSGALTEELMPEQRLWTVQSLISLKIQQCDEFWIFETLQERDKKTGNIVHYSYWDSWWCVAEVMEVLQMNTRGQLNENFKFIIFNPSRPKGQECYIVPLSCLPKLTVFEDRELMRLRNEGNIFLNNQHLRKDKCRFRDASWLMKKLRYLNLRIQWYWYKKTLGKDISIPYDVYVEDVNCRAYEDTFLTQRIYMDSESMEIGRKMEDVFREGYCKYFLNIVGAYKDTPQYKGIYVISTEELENSVNRNLPIIVKRTEKEKTLQKKLQIEEYGKMFFFWSPLLVTPNRVKRTGPENDTIQEIVLYKVKNQ